MALLARHGLPPLTGPPHPPHLPPAVQTATSYALWPLLISVYYLVVLYYAAGPENVARWCAPLGRWVSARFRAAGRGAVDWAKAGCWRDPESMLEVHY